jgi:DegV family protein with EDD domain
MSKVAVVTDSTAYLPEGIAEKYAVTVVPLHVVLGTWSGKETTEVSPADVAAALRERRVHVTTSRPTPGALAAAYRATGATEVVSVHLSSALSGTTDSARLATQHVAAEGIEVRVVDSLSVGMGLGFPVIAAAEAAAGGAGLACVAAVAAEAALATRSFFYVDTLEHLRRGGRLTAASALLGTALAVKPLLVMRDGEIVLLEKVRTFSKALARLEALVLEAAGEGPVDLAVHHLAAPARAAQLAEDLRASVPGLQSLYVSEVGAVVGAHVGPGMLAVALWLR